MSGALRVAVDYRPVEERRAGIARYVYELIRRLFGTPGVGLYVLSGDPFCYMRRLDTAAQLDEPRLKVPFPFKKLMRSWYTEPGMYRALHVSDVQVLWGTNYYLPRPVKGPWKQVITVHDLAWRVYPDAVQTPMVRMLERLGQHVAVADHVLTVSEATKRDLVDWLGTDPAKVRVIYNGVDDKFRSLEIVPDRLRSRYGLPQRFFMFVGTVEPRKNLGRLVMAFERVAASVEQSLVIVGAKGWKTTPLYKAVHDSPYRDRIHFTGFVDDADLPAIYNLADAFVYPSLYEGFGIPVVEAMACGTPVVTSNVSALPEVAGDSALLVDPLDVPQLAEAMERIVHDEPLRATLRAKGLERAKRFSWDTSAAQVVQCFRELVHCGP